ncbi:MAG TPA: TspO/MBR family protein [Armatimonadota bacterium]|nr:TspO/MBR family protein [Armatimonadota bacterium]
MPTAQWGVLALFIAICLGAGGLGSLWTMPALSSWYASLEKPAWTPPGWLFGPVWTLLYISMGVAAWLVWRKCGLQGAALPLAVFAVQLLLNVAWTGIFFGMHLPGAAFAEIILLWIAILATLILFRHVSPAAGWLLLPYLLWVGFAAALNFSIWQLNR